MDKTRMTTVDIVDEFNRISDVDITDETQSDIDFPKIIWVRAEEIKKAIEDACHSAGEPNWNGENHVINTHWKQLAEHILKELKKGGV